MNLLIKQATIISSNSKFHHKTIDILIEGGVITEIKNNIQTKSNVKLIEVKGLCVSTGWLDLQAVSCDPGYENKEDLDSLIKCAASGGFTGVCIHNYNLPPLHNKVQIEYVLNKTQNKLVDVFPFGTITFEGKGKDLAEMFDMKQSGSLAFSDYKSPINDAGLLMRALQYSTNINSLIITHANEDSISHLGQMNEGEISTSLGLKGMPSLSEELMVQRNISILEYTGGHLHIPTISSKRSIELIKKAKSNGLNVTCGVAAINLFCDDSSLLEFDTNYKLNPPLRSKKDMLALRNAIEIGVIDVIVSDHAPHDTESKDLEFDLADFGMIGLQTAFSCALEGLKENNIDCIIKSFTTNPRQILGLDEPLIADGQLANLTLFTLEDQTMLTAKTNLSKSRNSPFFGKQLKGKIIGIVKGSKTFFN